MSRRIPLTGSGWCVVAAAVILGLVGRAWGYPVLVTLGLTGLAVLALAGVTVVVRPSLRLTRSVAPDRISVGEPAAGRLVVRNLARWPLPAMVVVDRVDDRPHGIQVPVLRAGGSRTVHYPIPTDRRGRLPLGPLSVERQDPFGLFRRAQLHRDTGVLWVHPRVHPSYPVPVGTVPDFEGRAELSKAGTTWFSSLREYVPGDDPRRIHWRSTAHTGQLIVRESTDTMEPAVTIVLDTRSSVLDAAMFEHAVEVAASVAQGTVDGGRPARIQILGEDVPAVIAAGAVSLLDRLAAAVREPDAEPVHLLEEVDRAEPGGALVVVTGAGEPAVVARLAEQRRRFAPVVVITVVAAGLPLPAPYRRPGMVVLSGRTGAEAMAAWNHFVLGGVAG
ncbi:MAG TPA: DUF58 domain-containing protein [Actinophytocola sp.]|uniref:DUF58 domain-containing protein n=1 Tax=Actinophytocola sp. TaxID=1872138 RepID=UPI002DDCBF15|nr:DUF58 domain-containing protein [Actinophytocola sp.]HEV2780925.1 DUF58 domain-containing protein [Actinophytocola sp.]